MKKIFLSALIVTMNETREILNQSALVTEGKHILDMGTDREILQKYPQAEIIDCKGKVILPGFINMHTHQTLSIIRGVAEDMGTAPAYTKSVPQGQELSGEESRVMATLGALEALRFGSTYICDMYTNCDINAQVFSELGMRANVCEMVHDMDFFSLYQRKYVQDRQLGETLLEKNLRLLEKWRGHDLIDTSIGLHAPDTCSPELIAEIVEARDRYQVRIATHLAQSRGELARIREAAGQRSSVEFYEENGVLNDKLIAAHCIYINEKDMRLLARHNVNAVHIAEGNAKGGMVASLAEWKRHGINVTLGTDNGSADMIEVMRMALCIGRVLTDSMEPKPMELLEMATVNAAKAIGREKELGSLEPGKLADLLVVDYKKAHMIPCLNPVGTLLHTGLGSDIDTVMVNGKILVKDGGFVLADEQEILREGQRIAERRWRAVNHEINPAWFIHLE